MKTATTSRKRISPEDALKTADEQINNALAAF